MVAVVRTPGTYPEGHAGSSRHQLPDAVQRRGDLGESLGEIAGDAGLMLLRALMALPKPIAETSSVPLSSIGSMK